MITKKIVGIGIFLIFIVLPTQVFALYGSNSDTIISEECMEVDFTLDTEVIRYRYLDEYFYLGSDDNYSYNKGGWQHQGKSSRGISNWVFVNDINPIMWLIKDRIDVADYKSISEELKNMNENEGISYLQKGPYDSSIRECNNINEVIETCKTRTESVSYTRGGWGNLVGTTETIDVEWVEYLEIITPGHYFIDKSCNNVDINEVDGVTITSEDFFDLTVMGGSDVAVSSSKLVNLRVKGNSYVIIFDGTEIRGDIIVEKGSVVKILPEVTLGVNSILRSRDERGIIFGDYYKKDYCPEDIQGWYVWIKSESCLENIDLIDSYNLIFGGSNPVKQCKFFDCEQSCKDNGYDIYGYYEHYLFQSKVNENSDIVFASIEGTCLEFELRNKVDYPEKHCLGDKSGESIPDLFFNGCSSLSMEKLFEEVICICSSWECESDDHCWSGQECDIVNRRCVEITEAITSEQILSFKEKVVDSAKVMIKDSCTYNDNWAESDFCKLIDDIEYGVLVHFNIGESKRQLYDEEPVIVRFTLNGKQIYSISRDYPKEELWAALTSTELASCPIGNPWMPTEEYD